MIIATLAAKVRQDHTAQTAQQAQEAQCTTCIVFAPYHSHTYRRTRQPHVRTPQQTNNSTTAA